MWLREWPCYNWDTFYSPSMWFIFTGRLAFCFIDLLLVLRFCLWLEENIEFDIQKLIFADFASFLPWSVFWFWHVKGMILYLFNLSSQSCCLYSLNNHLGIEQGIQQSIMVGAVGRNGPPSACVKMVKKQLLHYNRQTPRQCYRSWWAKIELVKFSWFVSSKYVCMHI